MGRDPSRILRITWPLRAAAGIALAHLRSHPRQKAMLLRLLSLSPRLANRLRWMAARQATGAIVRTWAAAPVHLQDGQLDPSAYPASVRASYARLMEARRRAELPQGPS